ncbi:MAG: hypothetical protein COB09_17120 [Thalassobium sp.]|nr:MAG: hypothetical protein COB09_17120 [Thalassobium sp.]
MGSIFQTVFGGGTSSASEQNVQNQQAQNAQLRQFIEQQTGQARQDVLGVFPQADFARNAGIQGALDVVGQGVPVELAALQQGNVGAQGVLGTGLEQFQNAILGDPLDFSGFSPQQIGVDTSFLQGVQLPDFVPQPAATPNATVPNIDAILGNLTGQGDFSGVNSILSLLGQQGTQGGGFAAPTSARGRGAFDAGIFGRANTGRGF